MMMNKICRLGYPLSAWPTSWPAAPSQEVPVFRISGVMDFWSYKVMKFWKFWSLESCPEVLKFWTHEVWKFWSHTQDLCMRRCLINSRSRGMTSNASLKCTCDLLLFSVNLSFSSSLRYVLTLCSLDLQDLGSWIQDPVHCIQDPGPWILGTGSWVLDPGSRILDRGSWIKWKWVINLLTPNPD